MLRFVASYANDKGGYEGEEFSGTDITAAAMEAQRRCGYGYRVVGIRVAEPPVYRRYAVRGEAIVFVCAQNEDDAMEIASSVLAHARLDDGYTGHASSVSDGFLDDSTVTAELCEPDHNEGRCDCALGGDTP